MLRRPFPGASLLSLVALAPLAAQPAPAAINSTEKGSGDYLEPAKLVACAKERKAAPGAMLMDEESAAVRAYDARTTPHLYVVDPQGKLVYAGGIDSIPSSNAADIPRATTTSGRRWPSRWPASR